MPESPYPPSGTSSTGHDATGIVNYGTISGPVAAGVHSHVTQHVNSGAGDDRMARLESALQQLIAAATRELDSPQAEEVGDDADRVAEEMRRPRPDRDRIAQLLGRITARVGSAAVLLEAVSRVKDLIEAILH